MTINGDRRQGVDRRVSELEGAYSSITERLDKIEEALNPLVKLANQITGVLIFLRFVGWSGLGTMALFLLRYAVKDMRGF